MASFPQTQEPKQKNEIQENIQISLEENENENEFDNENNTYEELSKEDRDENEIYKNIYSINKESAIKKNKINKSEKQPILSTKLTNKKKSEIKNKNIIKIKKTDMNNGAVKEIEIIDLESNQTEKLLQKKTKFDIVKKENNIYDYVNINNNLNNNLNKTEKKINEKKLFQTVLKKEKEKDNKDIHNEEEEEEEDCIDKLNIPINDDLYNTLYGDDDDDTINKNDEQNIVEVECNNKQYDRNIDSSNEINEPSNFVYNYGKFSISTKETNFKN